MTARERNAFARRFAGRLAGWMRWLCVVVIALTVSACEINEESVDQAAGGPTGGTPPPGSPPPPASPPPPPPPPPPMTEQALFEATLYPLLVDTANFCVSCHGSTQDPTFASADPTTAYNAIVSQQKVDLANPELSRVYLRPSDDRHNCGGVTECDRIAADFLVAIQDWANQATAGAPPPTGGPVVSAATNFAAAIDGGAARVEGNTIALFTFAEGSGTVTMDTSGVAPAIALQIEGMEWEDGGGLRNVSGKAQASEADSRKLFDMITPVNEYTVEAWLIPDNTAQDGPARMVSYSQDTGMRSFTLGQNAIYYQLRNRSTVTNDNGTPALEALDPQVRTELTHVVATFDGATGRKLYIDGQLSIEENLNTDTLNWLDNHVFVLGNEATNDRLWQGVFKLVAIHNKALDAAEVQQNFDAGTGSIVTLQFDVASVIGQPGYIEFQVAQVDAYGYLFARPTFVTDAIGTAVRNIRIGVNGGIPVATQPFRRVDTIVSSSSMELSPLGALIPVALGPDDDMFHLEFELLGTSLGRTEPVVPASPPAAVPDVMEPELGLRTFAKINDTMSVLTGIDANDAAVSALYDDLRSSLPSTSDLLSFAAAQQIAIQRLATAYCGAVVTDTGNCDAFFGTCSIDAAAKDQVADTLYDRFIGDNLVDQPDRAGVTTEIVGVIDDLGCAAGCNGATAETTLQASCAAVLSSAALTVN